ncbi:MAG: porin family protein [Burkholderiales bacterium]
MKKTTLSLALLAALGTASSAWATNWLQLQNNEAPDASTFKVFGFIQPTYSSNEGGAVNGLAGGKPVTAYNGRTPVFNTVTPDSTNRDELQIMRARIGARGYIPGTDKKINYFVLIEGGKNGITRTHDIAFSDAAVTFNYIPGARIKAGLFRAPTGEEAFQGVQVFDYIYFSGVTDGLLNERFLQKATPSAGRTAAPTTLAQSNVVGSVAGFRDVGVEVYDWFKKDKMEYAYAVMVGNGNGIDSLHDNNGSKDVTARVQAAYVFGGGGGPKREDVMGYLWHQEGKRTFGGQDYTRMREGVGAKYLRNGLRFSGEYIRGSGMILGGPNVPFQDIGAPAFQPLTTVGLGSSYKANGWYLDAGWRFMPKWEADVRYDEYDRFTNDAANERLFTTWTLGGQYFMSKSTRIAVNYDFRKQKVSNPGALTAANLNNATAIADSMGNRVTAQLTYLF